MPTKNAINTIHVTKATCQTQLLKRVPTRDGGVTWQARIHPDYCNDLARVGMVGVGEMG